MELEMSASLSAELPRNSRHAGGRSLLSRLASVVPIIIALGLICSLPLFASANIELLIVFAVYAALAVSWNWVAGYAGLLNLAHITYYGIGGYACAIAVAKLGVHPTVGMLAGAAISATLATAVSIASFKLKVSDLYYALLTLTLAEAVSALARGLENKFSVGGVLLTLSNDPASLAFVEKEAYYYLLIGLVVVMLLIQHFVMRSGFGLLIIASRDNHQAAESLGTPVSRVLTLISACSAAFAALIGSVVALVSLVVTTDVAFAFEPLLLIIIATCLGGIGTFWGPVFGAAIITIVHELIRRSFDPGQVTGLSDIMFGSFLIVIMVLAPVGLVGIVKGSRLTKYFKRSA